MIKKFVWDTSALLNIKEPDENGYSPAYSFYKNFNDGWIPGPYLNLFPAISIFELNASISRRHREGEKILRDYYILSPNSRIYDIDTKLIELSANLFETPGFNLLRGADLIFACIAHIEKAYLVTLDNGFSAVKDTIEIINLNESRSSATYRDLFR